MLNLLKDGAVVASTHDGGSLFFEGVGFSPAIAGQRSVIDRSETDWPPPGTYTVEVAPPPPEPEPLPPPTIEDIRAGMATLSPVQFRFMLDGIGFDDDDVNAAISGLLDPVVQKRARIYWEYATYFERVNPLIDGLGAGLGLSPEDIDAAWLAFTDAL